MTTPAPSAPAAGLPRKWTLAILVLAFLFVLMPFLFWQATWFGRPLTDEELARQLADLAHPRKTQHALAQIAERITRGDPGVSRWYPQVVASAQHNSDEIRTTAAWVMGQDNKVPEFHQALLRLLHDPNPMVRRNAALALVRFGDDSGHAEILALLRSYAVPAPEGGTLAHRLVAGDRVNPGTLLGRIRAQGREVELRAPVPGSLERWLAPDGASIAAGQEITRIAPSPAMVWEGLRALVLVGRSEDLPDVEPYARGIAGMPDSIRQQAQQTARAIQSR